MKTRTKTGFKLTKNGKPYKDSKELRRKSFEGSIIKENGSYFYFVGKRLGEHIYELINYENTDSNKTKKQF